MMEECTPTVNTGLRGVTVASTKISRVDGAAGKLIYRGYLVKDLAENASYEEVAHLLLYEHLPSTRELSSFKAFLAANRALPESVLNVLKCCAPETNPMDILQGVVSLMAVGDPDLNDRNREASLRKAGRLIAKFRRSLPPGTGSATAKRPYRRTRTWIMPPIFSTCSMMKNRTRN